MPCFSRGHDDVNGCRNLPHCQRPDQTPNYARGCAQRREQARGADKAHPGHRLLQADQPALGKGRARSWLSSFLRIFVGCRNIRLFGVCLAMLSVSYFLCSPAWTATLRDSHCLRTSPENTKERIREAPVLPSSASLWQRMQYGVAECRQMPAQDATMNQFVSTEKLPGSNRKQTGGSCFQLEGVPLIMNLSSATRETMA